MKSGVTDQLEKAIRRATRKMGVFGCFEVTIGFFGKERVDYMTYDTKGIFRCYEIKASKSDFHSGAAKSFVGHYNYYVLTHSLYKEVQDEIPPEIGIYVGEVCYKKARRQDIDSKTYSMRRSIGGKSTEVTIPWTDMLKESLIRSLYRDSDKLLLGGDEQYTNRLRQRAEKAVQDSKENSRKYSKLYCAVEKEIGYKALREIMDRAGI